MANPGPSLGAKALAGIGLPNTFSVLSALLLGSFVIGAAWSIETTGTALIGAKDQVVHFFDWLFVLSANACLLLVIALGLYPKANVKLGDPATKPEFGYVAWFAMLFSAGLASGLLYWATAEPILHHQGNPMLGDAGIAPGSKAAATVALRITVMHWGLHGWAFYVVAALGIGVYSYRYGRPLTFRSALIPVVGPRWIDRWPGRAIDLMALLGTFCGVATSIGLSAAGMNATLQSLFGIEINLSYQTAIVFGVCALGVASAVSGISRGIRRLSELNVWLSGVLLLAFLALGPAAELVQLVFTTLVDYTVSFLPTGLWLSETPEEQAWQADWTVFYWGWWLAWTPFVSLFIARISKGRTVREFTLAVMLVPTLVIVLWMAIVGGTALAQEIANPGAVSTAVNRDYALGITTVIENLAPPPVSTALVALAAFLLFTWLITSLDSATLVICHLLDVAESPAAKTFWGAALAAVTVALIWVGGVPALQAASILIGLPLALIVIALGAGLLKDAAMGRLEGR